MVVIDAVIRLVPGVLVLAAATALYLWGRGCSPDDAILRAVTVLVITCPCALGIATPLARVAAIGVGRQLGMVFRDAGALEKLSSIDVIVFDKTGTLTQGTFALREVVAAGTDEAAVLSRAASLELHADHFLAREIVRKAEEAGIEVDPALRFEVLEGQGVRGVVECVGEVIVGNRLCLQTHGLNLAPDLDELATRDDDLLAVGQSREHQEDGAGTDRPGWPRADRRR